MAVKKRGLGRGLESLLGSSAGPAPEEAAGTGDALATLPIDALQPGKYQPRTGMDPEKLAELAGSIRSQGLIQPIVVRAVGADRYEIIAGERRWRAARQAGLTEVPVVRREVEDRAAIAMALIENIQREDLNPLEEAQALARLIEEFGLTHQQAAEAVGRGRSAVSNLLRLLELPEPIRRLVEARRIEMGHARALLTLPERQAVALAQEAADEELSVREVEQRVQRLTQGIPQPAAKPKNLPDADIAALEREMSETLGTRVAVQHGKGGKGRLVIHYHGLDTLEGVLERLRARSS
ncbi:ParB/RepB/Spo0J family partition protein [Coralloluteibacterium stylophorae]|uniref:Probable chromosome-partitioning protein ParB n=1 Tax=Coralloluteibacterium stylophorae TaxID=1776034 RepID=A0A8J7VTU9_9GAMM|nr:ParB/RepB/Spo0J family partition protein [Coralloluteibacterium stylophorae]MBS7457075.1 ParB/RepB/Spo0J family partition protein [Coralloluteibacterium stylophorae]